MQHLYPSAVNGRMSEWSRLRRIARTLRRRRGRVGSRACFPTACCAGGVRCGGRRSPSSCIGYWLYSLGRNAVPEQASIALRHGRSVQHLQDVLHLNFELSVNAFVARNEWLAQVMDYYYATLHFIITIGVLVWLFSRRPHLYRGVRTVLFATTLFGLAGFYLYPLAPPRLLPQYGYIDTLLKFHTWGSLADPDVAKHSNQFAAMPSLHIAWAMWCGITHLHVRAAPVGARARPALPVRHADGDRRDREPLHHRRRRRCRRARRSASACSTSSPATARSSPPADAPDAATRRRRLTPQGRRGHLSADGSGVRQSRAGGAGGVPRALPRRAARLGGPRTDAGQRRLAAGQQRHARRPRASTARRRRTGSPWPTSSASAGIAIGAYTLIRRSAAPVSAPRRCADRGAWWRSPSSLARCSGSPSPSLRSAR